MAKFSKAHYKVICDAIKNSVEDMNSLSSFDYTGYFDGLRKNLARVLAADNPKFDEKRFLKASQPEVKRS